MPDDDAEDEGLQVAEIKIRRSLHDSGNDSSDQVWVTTSEGMSLLEALGLLRFAEMTIIEEFSQDDGE